MPQKVSRPVSRIDDDNDGDTLSQGGKAPDSDDRELELYAKAVAEFRVTWQKQKRAKERQFLKTAQAELDEHVDRKTGEVQGIMREMEETYQDFLSKYAAIEDQQREVIVKIVETQKTLVALSVKKHQETLALTDKLEEGQVESLKQMKKTCQDFTGMVDTFMQI